MEASTSINAPHPDADPDEEAKFFGEVEVGDTKAEELSPDEKGETEPDTEPDPADFNPESGSFDEADPKKEQPVAEESVATEVADPTDAPSNSPAEGANGAADSASLASSGTEDAKKRGSIDREYIVFQKVPLTKAALAHLAKVLEAGDEGKVRIAYMEVDRLQARNAVQAVGVTFLANQESLGEKGATLAAVSSKSFQEKTVKPKQNIETTLDIS